MLLTYKRSWTEWIGRLNVNAIIRFWFCFCSVRICWTEQKNTRKPFCSCCQTSDGDNGVWCICFCGAVGNGKGFQVQQSLKLELMGLWPLREGTETWWKLCCMSAEAGVPGDPGKLAFHISETLFWFKIREGLTCEFSRFFCWLDLGSIWLTALTPATEMRVWEHLYWLESKITWCSSVF